MTAKSKKYIFWGLLGLGVFIIWKRYGRAIGAGMEPITGIPARIVTRSTVTSAPVEGPKIYDLAGKTSGGID